MPRKRPTIKYTSRDYSSIRNDLLAHAKRYYSDTYRDFSEASFGSLVLDTVSYVGDILSFYLDYQVNESFIDTAIEYENVIRLGRQAGYKFTRAHSSFGMLACYVIIPAQSEGLGPDSTYVPILKKGSFFSSTRGNGFMLMEDVDFSLPENEVVVAAVDPASGVPTSYAVKAYGKVMSGEKRQIIVTAGPYEKFKRITVPDRNITEIVSVIDSEGHEYFQVDYLSQNVVYKDAINMNSDSDQVPSVLKPIVVPRRFVVVHETNQSYLQFGYGDDSVVQDNVVADPNDLVLERHGRTYTTDLSFDPSKLMETDKFGIVPANTSLRITYRKNVDSNANAAARTVTKIAQAEFRFTNQATLSTSKLSAVRGSLEVENESPINGDVSLPLVDELKTRITDVFAAQNRAVTKQDYKAVIYSMPGKLGAIKRCNIIQDKNSFKRNLNLYIISNLRNGQLTTATSTLKENLRTWLNKNRMINDTIDILDAKIINLIVDFEIVANLDFEKEQVLNNAYIALRKYFAIKKDIAEPLVITDIYNQLNKVRGVSDTTRVKVTNVVTSGYSQVGYDIDEHTSADGKVVYCPKNAIFEVKRLFKDIRGVVK